MNKDELLDKEWGQRYDTPKPQQFEDDKACEQDEQQKFVVEKAIKSMKDGDILCLTDIHNYSIHRVSMDNGDIKIYCDETITTISFKIGDNIGLISLYHDTLTFPVAVRAIYNQLNELKIC